jgi:hypothetical protein
LTVENARPFTTLHPRCGNSFLVIVMAISILNFLLLGSDTPTLPQLGSRCSFCRWSPRVLRNPEGLAWAEDNWLVRASTGRA